MRKDAEDLIGRTFGFLKVIRGLRIAELALPAGDANVLNAEKK